MMHHHGPVKPLPESFSGSGSWRKVVPTQASVHFFEEAGFILPGGALEENGGSFVVEHIIAYYYFFLNIMAKSYKLTDVSRHPCLCCVQVNKRDNYLHTK